MFVKAECRRRNNNPPPPHPHSPGTFFPEQTEKPIEAWDTEIATRMARKIKERYGATPYAFRFTTRGRAADELDSKVVKSSPLYYLGGTIRSAEEVLKGTDPEEEILRSNVRGNKIKRIIANFTMTISCWIISHDLPKRRRETTRRLPRSIRRCGQPLARVPRVRTCIRLSVPSPRRLSGVELRAETFERQYRQACADVATGVERASALAARCEMLETALGQVAGKNNLAGVPDDTLLSAAFNALYECELIAREALSRAAVTAVKAE